MSDKKLTEMFEGWPMKPIIILEPGVMSEADVTLLRENHLCVVVATNPATVKFVDPIPAVSQRDKIESSAIMFSRKILAQGCWNNPDFRKTLTEMFMDVLISGTPLDPKPSQTEMEKRAYDEARLDEQRRIAREEVKAEKAAAKAAKLAQPKKS